MAMLPYLTARSMGKIGPNVTAEQYASMGGVDDGAGQAQSNTTAMGNNRTGAADIAAMREAARARQAANAQTEKAQNYQGPTTTMAPGMKTTVGNLMSQRTAQWNYIKAQDLFAKASYRGGLSDDEYQWLYDNRAAITQGAAAKHGGTGNQGFQMDRMIRTLNDIGSGRVGQNIVRDNKSGVPPQQQQQQQQAQPAQQGAASNQSDLQRLRQQVFTRPEKGGMNQLHERSGPVLQNQPYYEGKVRGGPVLQYPDKLDSHGTIMNPPGGRPEWQRLDRTRLSTTLPTEPDPSIVKLKPVGTGPYNPDIDRTQPGDQRINAVRPTGPFAGGARSSSKAPGGMDQKGGPGPDPNIRVSDGPSDTQIKSQRAGFSGNRRFHPFSGNGSKNRTLGG